MLAESQFVRLRTPPAIVQKTGPIANWGRNVMFQLAEVAVPRSLFQHRHEGFPPGVERPPA